MTNSGGGGGGGSRKVRENSGNCKMINFVTFVENIIGILKSRRFLLAGIWRREIIM
jgi:hypothetical protein